MQVILTIDRPTKLDFVDVTLRGRQGWSVGGGNASIQVVREVPALEMRVMGKGELQAGEHRFPLAFTLPWGAAPTHELRPAFSRLLIGVHASVPWWPDGRYEFSAPVRITPPTNILRTPVITRQPFSSKGNEPRLELSLASTTLVAGEALVGSCALFHMSDDKPRDVVLGFESVLTMRGSGRAFLRQGPGYQTVITIPAGASGETVPFRVPLPATMTPSFRSHTHDVSWSMTASVGSLFSTRLSLSLHITIIDPRAASLVAPLTLAPRVADQRVIAAFERLAARTGMTLTEPDDRYPDEQPVVTRTLGDAVLRLGYAYRGVEGTFLVGRVAFRSLGLGLAVTPSSPLREAMSRDIEIDVAVWDRYHHVVARFPEQVVPFLRGALPGAACGDLVRWTDDELVTERAIGAVEELDLVSMAISLEAVTEAIARARRSIPPPPGISVDLTAWYDLAARFSGDLTVGDLSIEGTLDMQPISVGLVFGAHHEPAAVRIAVGTPNPVDTGDPSERVQQMLANVARDLPDVMLHEGVASATIAITDGRTDPTRIRDVARTLRAIIAALGDGEGPYR